MDWSAYACVCVCVRAKEGKKTNLELHPMKTQRMEEAF